MPKPITAEMLHAMSPAQRSTLHGNASSMDTPASRALLELLAQEGFLPAIKLPKAPAERKTKARARDAEVPTTKTASFGRTA